MDLCGTIKSQHVLVFRAFQTSLKESQNLFVLFISVTGLLTNDVMRLTSVQQLIIRDVYRNGQNE